MTAAELIKHHSLVQHPEGGWYKETYRSREIVPSNALPERFTGSRSLSTAIFFLLEKGDYSAFHKIKSDECWHFYAGQTLLIHVIDADGKMEIIRLGNNTAKGDVFQYMVPAGCWFASIPAEESAFSFVGCTVSPGFDFDDFEMAAYSELSEEYPQHADLLKMLCRQ